MVKKLKIYQAKIEKSQSLPSSSSSPSSVITRDEEKRLASVLEQKTALFMRFFLETGCTVSEGLRFLTNYLNTGNIMPEEGSLPGGEILPAGFFPVDIAEGRRRRSSGEIPSRRVFCRRRVVAELSDAFSGHPSSIEPSGSSGLPSRGALTMRLKRASQAALGKSVTPAVLRHTCAARLFSAGADLITVSAYLGHASPSITAALYLDAPGFPLPGRPLPKDLGLRNAGSRNQGDTTSNYSDSRFSDTWFSDLVRYLGHHP